MIDCSCGTIHESNWKIPVLELDDGTELMAWVLCVEHARHEPCRPCMARDAQEAGYYNYQEAVRDKFKRMS